MKYLIAETTLETRQIQVHLLQTYQTYKRDVPGANGFFESQYYPIVLTIKLIVIGLSRAAILWNLGTCPGGNM